MKAKIVLITGGSRGLGREMALESAARGIDVILTYHSKHDEALKVVKEIEGKGRRAAALQLDTGKSATFAGFTQSVKETLAKNWSTERLDFLVNNAGVGVHASFAETTEAQFDQLMNIHLKGVFFLTQALLPMLNDGGRIVNVSSGLARFATPGYAAYGSLKGAVEVLTRYLAKELGPRRISVNAVAPGAIETDFGGGAVRDIAELNKQIAGVTAQGRVGKPADIGGVVANLLLPEMNWITGQRIEVSGGMFL